MKPVLDPMRLLAGVVILAGTVMLAGCGKKEPEAVVPKDAPPAAGTTITPPAASNDREIRITSIQPDNTSLITGQTVKLTVSAAYTLPAQGGSVGIVVQDGKSVLVANKLKPVGGGSGTVSEEIEFKVPATDRVAVHVPLYVKDEKKSATVSSREYTVRPK
jgi:hypothetical protein